MGDYNGWRNHATWQTNLFLQGDYGSEHMPAWEVSVRAYAQAGKLRELVQLATGQAFVMLEATACPALLRLYITDLATGRLGDVDWEQLEAHHSEVPA